LGGKLGRRRGQLNALGGLIFLQDSVSKQQFLVDTGAAVSVFPHRSSAATSGPLLAGADGKPISAWGRVTKKLNFGLHTFIVSFILAAVSKPILGIDFLSAHRLLVDPFAKAVLFASSLEPVGRTISSAPSRFAASISHIVPAVRTLLASWRHAPALSATARVRRGRAMASAILLNLQAGLFSPKPTAWIRIS
jgi:hypothetical protein